MGLTAKDKPSTTTPIEEGVHHAICYGVVDLGTHYSEVYKKAVHKVMLLWELPDERITWEGKDMPRAIKARFTLSLHKKSSLRPFLEAWRGQAFTPEELLAFDMKRMIGANCQLQVIHNKVDSNVYANVAAVMRLPKGTAKRALENPPLYYSMEDSLEFPENMPEWIKDIIRASKEFSGIPDAPKQQNPNSAPMTENDELPF